MKILAKNNTAEDITLIRLHGYIIGAGEEHELTDIFSIVEIERAEVLKEKVGNGDIQIRISDTDNYLSVEDGLLHITASTAYNAKTTPPSSGENPPENPGGGQSYFDPTEGSLYYWDSIREYWLSMSKESIIYYRDKKTDGAYLPSNNDKKETDTIIPIESVITKISIGIDSGENTKSFDIRNDGVTIGTFALNGGNTFIDSAVNILLPAGAKLQVYVSKDGGNVTGAKVSLTVAERRPV